jgi:8-oxo-dGTP pyrophosphatase MutT (NUDIX family)
MTPQADSLQGVNAAVLVPVYRDPEGAIHLVMIVRQPGGVHGSQVALPGGRPEPEDADFLETALREAEEEIGLPRRRVTVLAALPIVDTATSGYRIAPFLGRVEGGPLSWSLQQSEVADILDLPITSLLDTGMHIEPDPAAQSEPGAWRHPYYALGEHRLWGATYRIVHPLLPRLMAEEWTI